MSTDLPEVPRRDALDVPGRLAAAAGDIAMRVGISSCLLGNPVRYDGGHKLDRYKIAPLPSRSLKSPDE